MRIRFYLIILTSVCLFSCKPQRFNEIFDSVIIYDYGRSPIGTTYDVPVKFFFNNKEIATFHLYSFYSDLESGVYNYNDVKRSTNGIAFEKFGCSNKTFFKGECKWGDNIITGGTVTVDKQGDKYTFIVDVVDNKGEQHYGKFNGKVKKEDWYKKSQTGLFAAVTIGESLTQVEGYKITVVQLDAGDTKNNLTVSISIIKPENNNGITGVHQVYYNAHIAYAIDNGLEVCNNWCSYKNYPVEDNLPYGVNFMELNTGTITVMRVNKPWKYEIDVDVVAANGYEIKGSYTGVTTNFFQGYDPEK